MILINPYSIYTEFLDHFLTIIQDEEQRNHATLVSNFLRSGILNSTISTNDSAIPLSAVIKSGLIDKQGNFVVDSEKTKSIIFFFDKARTTMPLERLGIDCSKLTEMQKIILITACQEAMNRVIAGPLKQCAANLLHITDETQQAFIHDLVKNTDKTAFQQIAQSIEFNQGSPTLTAESLLLINRQRRLFSQMNSNKSDISINDKEFVAAQDPEPALLSLPQRVLLLDELIPTLTLDPAQLSAEEEHEHLAKLRLLQLYATILAMTKNNAWQVKAQWLRTGDSIQVGGQNITLPSSASEMMNVISEELAKKHKANYKEALIRVQTIAANYGQDWYTWTRNKLPYFSSSESLKKLLEEVLEIKVDGIPQVQVERNPSVVTKVLQYAFWGSEEKKDSGATSSAQAAP